MSCHKVALLVREGGGHVDGQRDVELAKLGGYAVHWHALVRQSERLAVPGDPAMADRHWVPVEVPDGSLESEQRLRREHSVTRSRTDRYSSGPRRGRSVARAQTLTRASTRT